LRVTAKLVCVRVAGRSEPIVGRYLDELFECISQWRSAWCTKAELSDPLIRVKDDSGKIHAEGAIPSTRFDLDRWMKTLPQPWIAAMEATLFTG
jgi:hypothetical protein